MIKLKDQNKQDLYLSIKNITAITLHGTNTVIYTVDGKQWEVKETRAQVIDKIDYENH